MANVESAFIYNPGWTEKRSMTIAKMQLTTYSVFGCVYTSSKLVRC